MAVSFIQPSDPAPTVVHLVHSLQGGGTERTLLRLLQSMRTPGIDHVLATLRTPGTLAEELPSHVPSLSLGISGTSRTAGIRLARRLRALGPCLLHARNPGTWADAVLARLWTRNIRLLLGFHGLEDAGSFRGRDRAIASVARRLGARFTSVCEASARQLTRELGIPARRIAVIPNGVDLNRFRPRSPEAVARIRVELRIPPRATVVGMVGTLSPVKRHDLLLNAVARLRRAGTDVHVLMVGDGPCRARLASLAVAGLPPSTVTFTGSRVDVAELLSAMDLVVNCSDSEGLSNALLEAMAGEIPVIATRVGGNVELVRDRVEGRLVSPGDPAELSAAIREVVSDAKLRRSLATAARRRAAEFSFTDTVARYERLYREGTAAVPTLRRSPRIDGGARASAELWADVRETPAESERSMCLKPRSVHSATAQLVGNAAPDSRAIRWRRHRA